MKVAINKSGQFLRVSECSSHGPSKAYSAYWGDLEYATLFADNVTDIVKTYSKQLKNPSDVSNANEVVAFLPAKEVRYIELI